MSNSLTISPLSTYSQKGLFMQKEENIEGTNITEENGVQKLQKYKINTKQVMVNKIIQPKENNENLDEKQLYKKSIIEKEDT